MTLVMAYVILIAAGISATAVLIEALVRARGVATRWVWVGALGLTTLATVFVMVVPKPATVFEAPVVETPIIASSNVAATPATPDVDLLLNSADLALPVVWGVASILLVVALGVGQRRYRRERSRAKAARVGGHDVLLTEDVGPAVAGVRKPVVFVPRWVLALDEGSQQLLLSHELEHVKKRDTWLLLFGAVSVAVTPWNPVVWWMVRRMRLAVEQDCDARVLARHPGIRRYADLLLTAASRHGLTSRLLAAHFGEYTSDLVRRIEAMTNVGRFSWRKIGGAMVVAAALVFVACETPRPDPVAPIRRKEVSVSIARSAEFSALVGRCSNGGSGCAISVIVKTSDGKLLRRYEGAIPVAEIPDKAVQNINVENGKCGNSECSLIWITLKPDASLQKSTLVEEKASATREVLVSSERVAVEREGMKLDSSAQLAIDDRRFRTHEAMVSDTKYQKVPKAKFQILEGRLEESGTGSLAVPPVMHLRGSTAPLTEVPNVLVSSVDGKELQRVLAGDRVGGMSLSAIRADDIEAVEVRKGTSCATLVIPCPAILVTIKPGLERIYQKR